MQDAQHLLASQTAALSQRDVLTSLLHEILAHAHDPTDSDFFRDPDMVSKLFTVAVRGMVGVIQDKELDSSDPVPAQQLVLDCLAVLRILLSHSADLLLVSSDLDGNRISSFRWLAARILALLTIASPEVVSAADQTLTLLFQVLHSRPDMWLSLEDLTNFAMLHVCSFLEMDPGASSALATDQDAFPQVYTDPQRVLLTLHLVTTVLSFQPLLKPKLNQALVRCWLYLHLRSHPDILVSLQACHVLYLRALCQVDDWPARINWLTKFLSPVTTIPLSVELKAAVSTLLTNLALHMTMSCNPSSDKQLDLDLFNAVRALASVTDSQYASIVNASIYVENCFNPDNHLVLKSDDGRNPMLDRYFASQAQRALRDPLERLFESLTTASHLSDFASTKFSHLCSPLKQSFVHKLGLYACLKAGTAHWSDPHDNVERIRCFVCDRLDSGLVKDAVDPDLGYLYQIFSDIVSSDGFQHDLDLRIVTAQALRRLLLSCPQPTIDFDSTSTLGRWLQTSLKSTSRHLRVAITRLLPCLAFGVDIDDDSNACPNFNRIVAYISEMSTDASLLETAVLSWGQLGRHCKGPRLNLMLVKLVDALSSDNTFHSSLAFDELQTMARVQHCSVWQLLSPFWSTLSIMVVNRGPELRHDLLARFSELLAVSPADFLSRTIAYTVPYLVADGRYNIVERICRVIGNTIPKHLYLDHVPAILAVLLTQDSPNPGLFAQKRWYGADPDFPAVHFAAVISPNIVKITFEILKLYQNDDRNDRIINALIFVAGARYPTKRDDPDLLQLLFNENTILQLVTLFSDTVRNVYGRMSVTTKMQCLRGMSLMMEHCGTFSAAVPQICTFLQAALDTQQLQPVTMRAWSVMVLRMTDDDLAAILDLTFALVVQKWPTLSANAKTACKEMLKSLVVERGSVVKALSARTGGLPSLQSISDLKPIATLVDSMRERKESRDNTVYHEIGHLMKRLRNDNVHVVRQTLVEVRDLLSQDQTAFVFRVFDNAMLLPRVEETLRTLLDTSFRFGVYRAYDDIALLVAECLGLIGALDPHRLDIAPRGKESVILHNFEEAGESVTFVSNLLDEYLVKTFRASMDPNQQMFLAYGIQELLKFCNFRPENVETDPDVQRRWTAFSPATRATLKPLLASKYTATQAVAEPVSCPVFEPGIDYAHWLRRFTNGLMVSVKGENAQKIFGLCKRTVRDLEQARPLYQAVLPVVALNVVIGGSHEASTQLIKEIHAILDCDEQAFLVGVSNQYDEEDAFGTKNLVAAFHETVFAIMDYFNRWVRERRRFLAPTKIDAKRSTSSPANDDQGIKAALKVLDTVSPSKLARRSYECGSSIRAVMYWEEHLRRTALSRHESERPTYSLESVETIYDRFQQIYAEISDPDLVEGMSTLIPNMNLNQQILHLENTGRWDSALECYDALGNWSLDVAAPADSTAKPSMVRMLSCYKESGRYSDLLVRLASVPEPDDRLVCLGIEASWLVGNIPVLRQWLGRTETVNFETSIGRAVLCLSECDSASCLFHIQRAREDVAQIPRKARVTSLAQIRQDTLRLHALADLEAIAHSGEAGMKQALREALDKRFGLIGVDYPGRSYLLSLRRVALSSWQGLHSAHEDIGRTWTVSAHDARKQGLTSLALRANIRSREYSTILSVVEHAKFLWAGGDQRKAMLALENVMDPIFLNTPARFIDGHKGTYPRDYAKAALLYTHWCDVSGQVGRSVILERYNALAKVHPKWEKIYYRWGKYYWKLHESQLELPEALRSPEFVTGEYLKAMVQQYLNSLLFGAKYVHETLPKAMTVWLDFAEDLLRRGETGSVHKTSASAIASARKAILNEINSCLSKYVSKIPTYMFYLVLPQLLSRISHTTDSVYKVMQAILLEVGRSYPSQALWSICALGRSNQVERANRGRVLINHLRTARASRSTASIGTSDLAKTIVQAEKLLSALQDLCYKPVPERRPVLSLSRDLGFDRSAIPCPLSVPAQAFMRVALPADQSEGLKSHRAFGQHVYIYSIEDTVSIQQSLQKPKRITVWGSSGQSYKLLCKPNDDVRKDARLMEFTLTIDRLLVRKDEAARRHLRIATYHVQPINEDCGLIEWIDGVEPLRGIISRGYQQHNVAVNWNQVRTLLGRSTEEEKLAGFKKLVHMYPVVLHEWFLEMFPEPSAWLAARTLFIRSAAVMAMVGYILGLGDRHGDNILLSSKNGGVMHVDFECLFDKGIDFDTPERVPFRLTHNLVGAMGVMGYEGPFRKACEVTLNLLRANQDSLMTVLETFLHDPIVEWSGTKKRKSSKRIINGLSSARSPQEALASVRNKIRGIVGQEALSLDTQAQVQYLIQQATSAVNLCQMFVGWAPFQ